MLVHSLLLWPWLWQPLPSTQSNLSVFGRVLELQVRDAIGKVNRSIWKSTALASILSDRHLVRATLTVEYRLCGLSADDDGGAVVVDDASIRLVSMMQLAYWLPTIWMHRSHYLFVVQYKRVSLAILLDMSSLLRQCLISGQLL